MSAANSVVLKFKTDDQTKGDFDRLQKRLKETEKKTNKLARGFRNTAQATAAMQGPLGGTAGRLSSIASLFSTLNPLTVGFGLALAGATTTLKTSLTVYADYEKQLFRIEGLLKSTGGASGLTAKQIDDLSRSIGAATLASAGDVREAAGVLLTFKSISEETFTRTLELSQDMAAVMGTNIKQSALQLAKALEDPLTGLTALRRSGVSFNQSQKDMIKAMLETGQQAKAQGLILDTLAQQLGGAGTAEGGGLAGSLDLVSENWNRFMEAIAEGAVSDNAEKFLNRMARGMERVANLIDPSDEQQLQTLLEKRGQILQRINDSVISDDVNAAQSRRLVILEEDLRVNQELSAEIENRLTKEKEAQQIAQQAAAEKRAQIAAEQQQQQQALEIKKQSIELDKEKQASIKGAENFAQSLQNEESLLEQSLMARRELEREFYEQRQFQIEENFQNNLISDQERNEQLEQSDRIHQGKLTQVTNKEAKKRASIESRVSRQITQMKFSVANQAIGLLKMLAGSNEKAQKAIIVLEKGLAIAQVKIQTEVAATRALAELGPIAGPPAAASIRGLGVVSMGLIAATGLAQLAGAGGGSSSLGSFPSAPNSGNVSGDALPQRDAERAGGGSLTINVTGIITDEIVDDLIVPAIQNGIENRDLVLIRKGTRNADELEE